MFLNPALVRLIGQYLRDNGPEANCGPNVPLFRSTRGKRLGGRQIQLNFARWCREAGIDRPASVHSLRHTFRNGDTDPDSYAHTYADGVPNRHTHSYPHPAAYSAGSDSLTNRA